MKRLNATIIEGPIEPPVGASETSRQQQQQRCDPQYCSMGCICDVRYSSQPATTAAMHRRQHCRQSGCILGCKCGFEEKHVNQTQEVKMDHTQDEEGEATALSSADVKYLREKATARLAKEEREFTHTVILTKNTTVLVHNKETESRRQKKKPKKYDDYYNDLSMQSLLNGGSVKDVTQYISKPPPNAKPLSAADRMRHAHVVLNKLPQLADIEPLCMVHDLYRCFCDGKATQGKPFTFTEDSCLSPAKTFVSDVPHSVDNGTLVVMSANGRMMGAKNRDKEPEIVQPSYDIASIANVRKRLYSFEKAHHEPLVDRSSSCSSDGKSSKGHHGTVQRKRRDSSEESYKPPNERKVAKKKPHTSFEEKSAAASASAASIRARRASVAPSHVYNRSLAARRPSVAITAPAALPPRKSDSLGIRRASVAHPLLPKEANVFKSPGKATAGDAQYTVVKPKRASGGINNIIIKRIPTPNANFEPMVNKATPLSKPLAKKSTPPSKTKVQGSVDLSVPPVKYMSVRKLKQLMISEYKNSPDVKQTPDNASCSEAKLAFVNILLLDSEENIDNEPQLNILSDGTKKLVINGNRRSFIESKAFKDGIPPERTMPYRNRTTYVVQILTASSAPEEEAMESKAPAAKAKSNEKVIQKRIAPLESSTSSSSGDPSCIEPDILMQSAAFAEKQSRSVQSQQQSVNNPTEQTDRQLCSLMRHINELLRRETLHINPAKKGIMHICRWNQMLNAFALGEIDVLDLTLTNGLEMTVIATAPFKQQLVPNVQHQISARRLTIDKMIAAERPSLLMKMVVCNVESVKTNELALVMYGNDNFWHFCGFLKVNEKYFKTDSNIPKIPSTFTNTKIRARLNEYHRKTFPSATNKMNTANTAKQTPSNKQQHSSSSSSSSSSSEPAPSTNMLSTQSNIEIMPKAIQPVHFPLGLLPGIGDSTDEVSACRWMRLKIENDFSHMYLPTWQCCVTYGRIKKAIYDANRLSKPIRLDNPAPTNQLHMQQRPYMYALPKEGHALFLGPYKSAEKKIDVILCQSVQGSLYEREVYEKQNGIPTTTNTKRTVGWWVDAATSRVATVKEKIRPTAIHKADRLAEAVKKLSGNTVQRSLLKRNNIPSATAVSTDQQIENDSKPIDNEVVIVESDDNDDDDGNNSKTNEQAPTRKDLSVDQIGMDLFRLVEGTMKQNQQEKREIEKVLEQERVTKSVILSDDHNRNEPNRKRQSSPVPHVSAAKVVRRSDTDIERVPALQQQQQKPVASSSVRVPPNTTIARNNFTRLSLHSPQSLKTGTNAVTRTNNGVSTLKITQLKPTEGVRHASRPLNALPGATGRALSLSKTAFTNEPGQPGGIAGAPKPRPRLNSIAVERVVSRPAPVVHDSDDEDDVVWVDDENDGNVTAKVPLASGSVERTEAAAVGSSINNGVTAYGQKTILSQEQIAMIARRVDLTKTGQQDGYSFNPASGLLKMKRSLLNSIKNDVMLGEASTLSSSVKSAVPPSLNGKVGVLINTAKPTLPSVSSTSVSGKAGVESSSTFTNNAKSTTPSASTSLNTSTTPSSTITMPRTKVVPRVTVTAATARYGDVPGRRISDGGVGNSVIPPGSAGTASGLLDNLKYLSEAQEEKLLAEQPYTRGVLESKIPGLGLVEVVRFEREVIIHMKELTVKKQLVSVQNLEAAVTLLNQFIQRNTYAFRPYNLAIQWKFKERSLSLRPEEKMTSVISQFCIVTVYGIINLSKPEQVKSVEFTLPALYEDLMKMKLAMQCYSKQHYEDEQCYENDDKIYDRAVGIITSVNAKSKWLTQQRETLMKQRRVNREKLRQLKEASSPAEGKNPPAKDTPVKDVSGVKGSQESVIVIDDD
uniref:MGA conserved domain-containing protein n=1 Tax=Anopheles christyi TaxID=43041 RepID=A0A182JQ56_9DIPT